MHAKESQRLTRIRIRHKAFWETYLRDAYIPGPVSCCIIVTYTIYYVAVDNKEEASSVAGAGVTEMVLVALRRIIRAIDIRSRVLVTRYGLTGPQLIVLRQLCSEDAVSVGELARAIHLSQATVTGILDRLVKRELVRRQRSEEDRRCVQVWLTESGRRLLVDAPPLLKEEFTEQFDNLEDWEQTQILSAIQRVVAMMEANHIDATPILTTGPVSATTAGTKAFLDQKQPNTGAESTNGDSAEPPEGTAPEP